jgi:creatinine amidohydrolase
MMSKAVQDDNVRLQLMTSEEVGLAIMRGSRTVLIPCGAIEQHGPHLPLCMDDDHAEALATLVARRLGGTLVAPSIRVGCSSHHMTFPGTISLRNGTFEAICLDYCSSLARHGFDRILLFSGHIGNFPVLRDMLPRLNAAVAEKASVEAFVDSESWVSRWQKAVAEAGGDPARVGGHADIAETSLMMTLRPESVRLDRFEPGHIGALSQEQLELMWKNGIASVSANGILGDPRGSSIAIGERCLEGIADLLSAAFAK